MALSHHRDQLLAWISGVVVLAVVTLLPGDVKLRVESAYALSTLTVAVVMGLVVILRGARFREDSVPSGGRPASALQAADPR